MKLEIKKIGNSTGLILPKELITRLNVQQGQWLHVTESADGGVRLTPYDPGFEQATAVVDEIMDEYKETLRAREITEPRWLKSEEVKAAHDK